MTDTTEAGDKRPAPGPQPSADGPNATLTADPADDGVSVHRVLKTTTYCALIAAGGHAVLWGGYLINKHSHSNWVPWQPVVGMALAAVATLAFGGFYAASRRARVAIASAFLLTFLVLLSYELTLTQLSVHFGDANDAANLVADLRREVGVIIAFYFGSEAAISVAKSIAVAVAPADRTQAILRSDRDVAVTAADTSTNVFELKTGGLPGIRKGAKRAPGPDG